MHNRYNKKTENGNMNFKVASMLLGRTNIWLFPDLLSGSSFKEEANSEKRRANGVFWQTVLKYQLADGTTKDSSKGAGRHDRIKELLKALRPYEGFTVVSGQNEDGSKYITEGELVTGIWFETEFYKNNVKLCDNFFHQLRVLEGLECKKVRVWRGDDSRLWICTTKEASVPANEVAVLPELPASPEVVESAPAKKEVVRKKKPTTTRKKKAAVTKAAAKLKTKK